MSAGSFLPFWTLLSAWLLLPRTILRAFGTKCAGFHFLALLFAGETLLFGLVAQLALRAFVVVE